jgi:O-acetyl-ADP-ribose deacetylase (regulator of RNase III)
MPITYLKGDATSPQAKGPKLIIHICNDAGGWGAGFVLGVSKRWKLPEQSYRRWYKDREPLTATVESHRDAGGHVPVTTTGYFKLGESQLVWVLPDTAVVNMIAQAGTRTGSNGPPIRYEALDCCMKHVRAYAHHFKASVHAPRIGCGLAGGRWSEVEPIIQRHLFDTRVYVYDYDG